MTHVQRSSSQGDKQEIEALRQRVAELEAQLAASERQRSAPAVPASLAARSAEPILQLIIDSLPGAVFWKNRDLVYQGCNRHFAAVAGVDEPANIVGKTDYDLAWKREEAEFFRQVDQRVMQAGQAEYHIIEPQLQADGKQAWLDTNKIPLYDEQGNVIGILGTFEDITERKRIEEALRTSEERFRTLVETIAVAAWIHQGGQFIYVNPATEALLGFSREELLAMKVWEIIHPDFREMVAQRAQSREQGEQVLPRYEIQVVTKAGEVRWVDLHASRIEFENQLSILVTFLDITERKEMEAALRSSEERFRQLIETIPTATLIHQAGKIRYTNRAGELLTGYSRDELQNVGLLELVHHDFQEKVARYSSARMRGEDVPLRYEIQFVTKHGEVRWLDASNRLIELSGEPAILVSGIDITERKEMEAALRSSEQRFRRMIETIPVAIFITLNGRFLDVNATAERMFGFTREQLLAKKVWDVVHPDYVELVQQRAAARLRGEDTPMHYEIQVITSDGNTLWIDMHASLMEFEGQTTIVITALDISERKRSEAERTHYQEAVIAAQREALRELSTPLIPLSRRTVVMPLVGQIDSARAQQVMDSLLQGIAQHNAQVAILDITGVPVVDSQIALMLIQAARAVQLLGAQVILTGIRPDVAQSLVGLDMSLEGMQTFSSLQVGIAAAMR